MALRPRSSSRSSCSRLRGPPVCRTKGGAMGRGLTARGGRRRGEHGRGGGLRRGLGRLPAPLCGALLPLLLQLQRLPRRPHRGHKIPYPRHSPRHRVWSEGSRRQHHSAASPAAAATGALLRRGGHSACAAQGGAAVLKGGRGSGSLERASRNRSGCRSSGDSSIGPRTSRPVPVEGFGGTGVCRRCSLLVQVRVRQMLLSCLPPCLSHRQRHPRPQTCLEGGTAGLDLGLQLQARGWVEGKGARGG